MPEYQCYAAAMCAAAPAIPFPKAFLLSSLNVVSLIICYQAFELIFNELKFIKEANNKYRSVTTEKKSLHFFLYLKLSISVHQVYTIFECSEYYLIHPAKEIFRKFPKMVIFDFILILPHVFY